MKSLNYLINTSE